MSGSVLIVGFNRPKLLQDRIEELVELVNNGIKIYVSIDGPRQGNLSDVAALSQVEHIIEAYSKLNLIQIQFSSENYGCDRHIFSAINQVLSQHEYVVVVEDDVAISKKAVLTMLKKAESQNEIGTVSPIVAMSGLFLPIPFLPNKWRKSRYFSAWGFALNKNFWELHKKTLSIENFEEVVRLKEKSQNWRKLSQRKKEIWEERISRTNYDYLIQRTIFLHDLNSIAPRLRMSDNVGHGINGAAHTRFKTPWYLKFQVLRRNDNFCQDLGRNVRKGFVLTWLDSQTWAGDGLLSVRGRTAGVRTILKRLGNA